MNWYIIDQAYVAYLLTFDSRVGYIDYGDRLKLYIGVLVEFNGQKYYVPVSSCKPKHRRMSNSLDFHKIIDPATGHFYAVINLNNMIPVPGGCVTLLKYDELQNYRSFADNKEKNNYIYLLQKEIEIIDGIADILHSKAERLYKTVGEQPNSRLSARCCNFKLLEEKCRLYRQKQK